MTIKANTSDEYRPGTRAIAAMDWSHRLRDADSGEWFEAVTTLKRLGYEQDGANRDSGEFSFWLRDPELPDMQVTIIDGEVWRVAVERTSAHRGASTTSSKEERTP